MKDITIGVIGCGNMGSAIVRGMADNSIVPPGRIFLYDKDAHKAQALSDETGAHMKGMEGLLRDSSLLLVAVKPQDSGALLKEIAPYIEEQTLVSIMAGVTIDRIISLLGRQLPVARAMPNLAAFVSQSMTCIACNELVKDREPVEALFSSVGKVMEVSEQEMDAVTALSGSGPAYLFYLADAMAGAGIKAGLSEGTAKRLATQTIAGSAAYLAESGEDPSALVNKVASKGGTTEAALRVFGEEGLKDIVQKAVMAAKKRSEEISGS
ncbi:MAG: pyrroline-5-carboxylate reductase [Candidatus Omnitrophica bacterium]|nr:pyrroline-5-carboxylate reductase [Candidatus Omnitrophota bacterium]